MSMFFPSQAYRRTTKGAGNLCGPSIFPNRSRYGMMVIQRFAAFAELGVRDHANFIAEVWLKLPSWLTLVQTCTPPGFRV